MQLCKCLWLTPMHSDLEVKVNEKNIIVTLQNLQRGCLKFSILLQVLGVSHTLYMNTVPGWRTLPSRPQQQNMINVFKQPKREKPNDRIIRQQTCTCCHLLVLHTALFSRSLFFSNGISVTYGLFENYICRRQTSLLIADENNIKQWATPHFDENFTVKQFEKDESVNLIVSKIDVKTEQHRSDVHRHVRKYAG